MAAIQATGDSRKHLVYDSEDRTLQRTHHITVYKNKYFLKIPSPSTVHDCEKPETEK